MNNFTKFDLTQASSVLVLTCSSPYAPTNSTSLLSGFNCGKDYNYLNNFFWLIPPIEAIATISATTFQCSVCSAHFQTAGDFEKHSKVHSGEDPWKCPECAECFSQRSNLLQHLRTHYTYKTCGKDFFHVIHLNVHLRTHTGAKLFPCQTCGEKFATEYYLKQHVQTVHSGEKPFICPICSHPFALKGKMKEHLNRHAGEKKFECGSCDFKSVTKWELKEHSRSHNELRPFKCNLCPKRFKYMKILRCHKKIHRGERSFMCGWCWKYFKTKEDLEVHQEEIVHDSHECQFCGKKYLNKRSFQCHLRTHSTAEKEWLKCQFCSHQTVYGSSLKRHERMHREPGKFNCRYCSYSANKKGRTTTHERKEHAEVEISPIPNLPSS